MTELQFPSSTFVFAAPDANGNYIPASQVGKKKVTGIARKVTWGDRTLNVEIIFTKFVSKQQAEKVIQEHAEKIKALAEIFFNNENLEHLHLNKKSKLALSYKDGNKLKSKHSIVKELTYKKESLQASLKTLLNDAERKETLLELKKVSHALDLFKKGGLWQRLFGVFKDIFIADTTVLKASDLTQKKQAPQSDAKDQPTATIEAAPAPIVSRPKPTRAPPRPNRENKQPPTTPSEPGKSQRPLRPLPTPTHKAIPEETASEKTKLSETPSSTGIPEAPPKPAHVPTRDEESQTVKSQPQALLDQLKNPDPLKGLRKVEQQNQPSKNPMHNLIDGAINKRQSLLNKISNEREAKKDQEFLKNNPEFVNSNSSDWD